MEVVEALASLPSHSGASSPSKKAADSYKQFLNSLARSNSDKAFTIQKEYKGLLDPIVENKDEDNEPSDEMIDYGSSDNSQDSDGPFLTQGQGVLALAAPSLRDERTAVVIPVDGPQADPDTQEDPLSQVDNPPIDESSGGDIPHTSGGRQQQQVPRMSARIEATGAHNSRIDVRAVENTEARNIPGTNLNTHNSFSLLADEEILNKALEMGVNSDSFNLEKVSYLKDLEIARHNITSMHVSSVNNNVEDTNQILLLGLGNDQSEINSDEGEEDFTPVLSRKKRRAKKSACKIGRGGSHSKSGDATLGAQSKSCAAQVKAYNDHPLSGIVAGTRRRRKNPKYL
jgi:hypothetical protein